MSELSTAVSTLVEITDPNDWEFGSVGHECFRYRKFVHKPSKYEIHLGDEGFHRGRVYVQGMRVDGWLDKRRIRKSLHKLLARQANEALLIVGEEV